MTITTKTVHFALSIATMSLAFSCSNREETPVAKALETKTISNLYAPQTGGQGQPIGGEFKKFNFATGTTTTDDKWDIAFRGTSIIVNGGTKIGISDEPERTGNGAIALVSGTLGDIKSVPESSVFKRDGANAYAIPNSSGQGWYTYNPTSHLITPNAGKIFVVKTHDGKYAKFEILSYYKDATATPTITTPSRYYTFKYVYQPTGTNF